MHPHARRLAARGLVALALGGLLLAPVAPARAADYSLSRYGARFGLSSDPDQVTLGGYAGFGNLTPDIQIRPSVDLGFGDNLFSVLLNADAEYFFRVEDIGLRPYLGAGLGLAYYDFDVPESAGRGFDDTTTEIGLNLFFGAEKSLSGYKTASLELRLGIDELPDFKVTLGFGFY